MPKIEKLKKIEHTSIDDVETIFPDEEEVFDKLNEIIAAVNEQEKKIDFIMENTEFADAPLRTLKELYER